MPTILLVDDDEPIRLLITAICTSLKIDVEWAGDGETAISMLRRRAYDALLLDLMLPKLSGIDVCREIRARSRVPIIMVTAKTSEIDTVVGLEVGADDYVTKPYRLRELVARMRAALRRAPRPETVTTSPGALEVGDVRLDPERHEVYVRGEPVTMPLKEFELLTFLLDNAGRVLTREVLIDRIWGADYVGDTKTLDVHIKRLRAKVEVDPSKPRRIVTIRGLGYKFDTPPR